MTDAAGQATATLSVTDPANRDIVITADAIGLTDTVTIEVSGSSLDVSGPAQVALGEDVQITLNLRDSEGTGVSGESIEVSVDSNTLDQTSVTTDATGQAIVNLDASTVVPQPSAPMHWTEPLPEPLK